MKNTTTAGKSGPSSAAPKSNGISREAWLEALQASEPRNDPDAVTIAELADMLGRSRSFAQRRINALLASGKARATEKRVADAAGRSQIKPAYVLTA